MFALVAFEQHGYIHKSTILTPPAELLCCVCNRRVGMQEEHSDPSFSPIHIVGTLFLIAHNISGGDLRGCYGPW